MTKHQATPSALARRLALVPGRQYRLDATPTGTLDVALEVHDARALLEEGAGLPRLLCDDAGPGGGERTLLRAPAAGDFAFVAVKLLAGAAPRKKGGGWSLEVRPSVLDASHPLFHVNGTEKGITFFTDTMGSVTLTGGRSNPRGAAAALLKDLINIYREAF